VGYIVVNSGLPSNQTRNDVGGVAATLGAIEGAKRTTAKRNGKIRYVCFNVVRNECVRARDMAKPDNMEGKILALTTPQLNSP
jgi:hypothetical protein